LAVFGFPVHAQRAPEPIFRYINIAPYGRIELGGPFQQVSALGDPVAPNLYRLIGPAGRAAQYADTEAILIELSDAHLVRAFYFTYLAGIQSFAEREAEYVNALGTPERLAYDSAQAHIKRSTWRDTQTEFELLEVTSKESKRVLSALRDRQSQAPTRPKS
jgi:hypothetical protein